MCIYAGGPGPLVVHRSLSMISIIVIVIVIVIVNIIMLSINIIIIISSSSSSIMSSSSSSSSSRSSLSRRRRSTGRRRGLTAARRDARARMCTANLSKIIDQSRVRPISHARFVVSRITIICHIICHFRRTPALEK